MGDAAIVRSPRAGDKAPVVCAVRWKNALPWTKWTAMLLVDDGLVIACLVLLIHADLSRCVRPSSMVAKRVCWKPIASSAGDQLGGPRVRTVTACWTIPPLTTPLAPAACPTEDAQNTTCATVLNWGGNSSASCNHPTEIPIWPHVRRSPWSAIPLFPAASPTNLVEPCLQISA